MKKYIIQTGVGDAFNAASKARRDAEAVAVSAGWEPFPFSGGRTADGSLTGAARLALDGLRNWRHLLRKAEPGSLILLQYPHYPVKSAYLYGRMLRRGQRRGLRFIALVHDLDSLRGLHGAGAVYGDRQVLPLFNAVICHNRHMRQHLIHQGINPDKLISLELFDYLTPAEPAPGPRGQGIAVAGNLSPDKSGYLTRLMGCCSLPLHLYGRGLEQRNTLPENVRLHGAFPPEELPARLEGAFGLVWDGPSAEACEGPAGEYLRLNNPHKLSLYMAAGLPAVLWQEAASADFVRDNGVGLTVPSLKDLESTLARITPEQYQSMCQRARAVGAMVRRGDYLRNALCRAEQLL